mmetsp:Transcript_2722/g.9882  ORF Transcript_2722/g.9882 Transcript_2722/m.9882 type:complete len:376 (-) Transcript_2722:427-1554(-)
MYGLASTGPSTACGRSTSDRGCSNPSFKIGSISQLAVAPVRTRRPLPVPSALPIDMDVADAVFSAIRPLGQTIQEASSMEASQLYNLAHVLESTSTDALRASLEGAEADILYAIQDVDPEVKGALEGAAAAAIVAIVGYKEDILFLSNRLKTVAPSEESSDLPPPAESEPEMSTSEASLIVSLLSASMIDGTEAAGEAVAEPSAAIATVDDEADSAAAPAVAIEGPLADAVVASSSAPEDADRDEQQEESLATEVEQLGDSLALPSLSLGTQIELDVANIHEPDCTEDEVLIHNMLPHEIHASERVTEPSIPPLEESIEEEFTNVVSHIQGSQSAVPGSQPHVFVWPYDAEKAEVPLGLTLPHCGSRVCPIRRTG